MLAESAKKIGKKHKEISM